MSSDHDNARYLEIYPHGHEVLLKPGKESVKCHRVDGALVLGQQVAGANKGRSAGGGVMSWLLPIRGTVAVGTTGAKYIALSEV